MAARKWSGPVLASISRVWLQLAGVVLIFATTFAVTPTEFGEFAIASAIYVIAGVMVGHGLYEYILKGDNWEASPSTSLVLNFASAGSIVLIAYLSSGLIDQLMRSDQVGTLLTWLAPVLFLQAISAVLEPVLLRDARIAYVSIATIIADTAAVLAALAALYWGLGVFALVVHKWIRESTYCFILVLGRPSRPLITFDVSVAVSALRFAGGIVFSRLSNNCILYGAELIIGFFLDPAAAGLFRLANKIISSVAEVVVYPLRMILWVTLPRLQDNAKAFSNQLIGAFEVAGVAYFALVAGVASVAWIALPIFIDAEWQAAIPVIAVLATARLVGYPVYLCEPVLAIRDRTSVLFVLNASHGVLSLTLLSILSRYGLMWASVSQLLTSIVVVGVALAVIIRFDTVSRESLLSLLARFGLCAAIMSLSVVACGHAAEAAGLNQWFVLVLAIGTGATTYIAAAVALFPEASSKFLQVAKGAARPALRWNH